MLFVGNPSLDTHDGGTPASWVWTSCQSLIGGIQDAFEGTSMLIMKYDLYFMKFFLLLKLRCLGKYRSHLSSKYNKLEVVHFSSIRVFEMCLHPLGGAWCSLCTYYCIVLLLQPTLLVLVYYVWLPV